MTHRARVVVLPLITCLAHGCLEPPPLEDLDPEPPLLDLGGAATWGPLDGSPIPALDDGPADGPESDGGAPESTEGPPDSDPALAQLRISEVLVDPEGKDGGTDSPELLEVANPGPHPVALDGLRIEAASWPNLDAAELGLIGVTLEVGHLLVIRRFATGVDPALGALEELGSIVSVGFVHGSGLRNADGVVTLASTLEVLDQLVYGADPSEPPSGWTGPALDAPSVGMSMCRVARATDSDTAADWSICSPNPGEPTPDGAGDPPAPIPPGAVQITEVQANPPGPASEEKPYEYIELINNSDVELELSNCWIGDDPSFDAPGVDPLEYLAGDGGCDSPTCLGPGARALVVGQGYAGPTGSALVLATDDSTIADGGLTNTEPVVLWDARGVAVSTYRLWPDPSAAPLPNDEQPLHRLDPDAPDEPQSWIVAPASPGE